LLATHGALALAKAAAQEQVRNLRRALDTSREIGIAMGVLMSQHKITRDQGFDMLRIASQRANRRLAEIASEVADTGQLTLPRPVTDER
jgi:AmiR/NasT family two-component response regulator